jgi:predicted RNA binding protein YcfA (HicA-like mRNA interferase family)
MPRIPGVSADQAIKALGKLGYRVIRQAKHVVLSNGVTRLSLPRHSPVNAFTMGAIAQDAGLTPDEFSALL